MAFSVCITPYSPQISKGSLQSTQLCTVGAEGDGEGVTPASGNKPCRDATDKRFPVQDNLSVPNYS